MNKKKILLVAPVVSPLSSEIFAFPPLGLLQVAALTSEDYKIELYDENVEKEKLNVQKYAKEVDLVGISVMTSQAPRAYKISKEFRARGIPVVMGGIHSTALPKEAAHYADAVDIGEAEGVWQKVLEDFEKGKLKKFYKSEEFPDLAEIPIPRRDILKKNSYILSNTIQVSRGCPFNCSFCSVSRFFGRTYRFRPLENVIKEIKMMIEDDKIHPLRKLLGRTIWEKFSRPTIAFMDDNIFGNKEYARKLFKALTPLRIFWGGQASINISRPENEEILALAAESGCKLLFVGFESISSQSLKQAHKRVNRPQEYQEAIKLFHKYRIAILGAFIFGFDSDDQILFEKTLNFVGKVKLDGLQVAILTPLPGTRLWEEFEAQGRIIERDWRAYDFTRAVYRPAKINSQELENGRKTVLEHFYSLGSILRRFPFSDFHRWFVYSALNYGYQKQVNK